METNNFITEHSPQNGRKLESAENRIPDIFIQCLVFNKTIISLTLVGYELMITDSVLRTLSAVQKVIFILYFIDIISNARS